MRWYIGQWVSGKDIIRLICVSKEMSEKVLSEGEYHYLDQENLRQQFKVQLVPKECYHKLTRLCLVDTIAVLSKSRHLSDFAMSKYKFLRRFDEDLLKN